jgi:hypothetical protein
MRAPLAPMATSVGLRTCPRQANGSIGSPRQTPNIPMWPRFTENPPNLLIGTSQHSLNRGCPPEADLVCNARGPPTEGREGGALELKHGPMDQALTAFEPPLLPSRVVQQEHS